MKPAWRHGSSVAPWLAALIVAGAAAPSWGAPPPRDSSARPALRRAPAEPAPVPGAGDTWKERLRELQDKLKSLRDQFHAELDPLQAKIKSLRDQFDPQLQQMQEQIKGLIEDHKPPAIQQLDREEDQELAALADREKAETEKLKERFAAERKGIQEKYDARRKELATKK